MRTLERLCVHESVGTKIPDTAFVDALNDLDTHVEISKMTNPPVLLTRWRRKQIERAIAG